MLDYNFQGNLIQQREDDGFVNLTQMVQIVSTKNVNDYLRLESTDAYLEALSLETGYPVSSFISIRKGRPANLQGTWAHPDIAIDFAHWISPTFRVWANRTIRLVIDGRLAPTDEESRQVADKLKEQWADLRKWNKDSFFVIGDEIKAYINIHPELTNDDLAYLYPICQDAINKGLFGKTSKIIKLELGIGKNKLSRDHYGKNALKAIEMIQRLAGAYISQNLHPLPAINKAISQYAYKLMSYKN